MSWNNDAIPQQHEQEQKPVLQGHVWRKVVQLLKPYPMLEPLLQKFDVCNQLCSITVFMCNQTGVPEFTQVKCMHVSLQEQNTSTLYEKAARFKSQQPPLDLSLSRSLG